MDNPTTLSAAFDAEQMRLIALRISPFAGQALLMCLEEIDRLRAALASPVHQPCAAPSAEQELRNIVNAKRWDRERFDDDSAFADWCTSRAGHTLMLIERERAAPSADGVAGDSKPASGHTT